MASIRRRKSRDLESDPLVVPVDRIHEENGLDVDVPVTTAWLDNVLGSESPFRAEKEGRVTAHLMRLDDTIHVRGRARLALTAPCSRCVNPTSLAFDAPLEVALFPEGNEPSASPDGGLSEDDLGVATYKNEEIDLGAIVHDEVFLELPMNPLCQQGCKGLCQQCGTDLNVEKCTCEKPIDPRWSALGQIKLN